MDNLFKIRTNKGALHERSCATFQGFIYKNGHLFIAKWTIEQDRQRTLLDQMLGDTAQ